VQLQQQQQFLFSAQKTIAEIEIKGAPAPLALRTDLPIPTREYPLIKQSEIQNLRVIYFADQFPARKIPMSHRFPAQRPAYDVTQSELMW
jgi:hypothetical protein